MKRCLCNFVELKCFDSFSIDQGTLIQHLKEHILHGNMTSNDVIFYYTTVSDYNKLALQNTKCCSLPPPPQTGWMMWNWLVSALAVGATVILYDGSPFIPSPNVLWDCVDEFGLVLFNSFSPQTFTKRFSLCGSKN